MKTKTKNRVTKVEDALWDMHGQISDMMNTLYEMQHKLPKTKYENTLDKMEELMLHLDNAHYTIERELLTDSSLLLEDAYYSNELDTSLTHHREVKTKLDKHEEEQKVKMLERAKNDQRHCFFDRTHPGKEWRFINSRKGCVYEYKKN